MNDPFERDTCDLDSLDPDDAPIGRGTTGMVYGLTGDPRWVYKAYTKATLADPRFDPEALMEAIQWRRTLKFEDRELVNQALCWPRTAVTKRKQLVGVVLPRIPPPFSFPLDGSQSFRTFDHLYLHPKRIVPLGLHPIPHLVRVGHLYALARVLGLMEKHRIVHGDISQGNVLYSYQAGRPGVFLIDCDSVGVDGHGAFAVKGTPYWQDPRVRQGTIAEPDIDSDRYALGLAVYRVWNRTPGNLSPGTKVELDPPATPEISRLLNRALSKRVPRPSATSWAEALAGYLRSQAGGAEIATATERLPREHQWSESDVVAIGDDGADTQSRATGGALLGDPTSVNGRQCLACGALAATDHLFCRTCGSELADMDASSVKKRATGERNKCGNCGLKPDPGHMFCRSCGSRLELRSG